MVFCSISCEEELIIKHTEETKIVVNAILQVDEVIEVEVSKSRNILDSEDEVELDKKCRRFPKWK